MSRIYVHVIIFRNNIQSIFSALFVLLEHSEINTLVLNPSDNHLLQNLLLILLIEGFVTISVEILSIRQLLPFFGNSVIITSIIIGIFLLFLALGYWRGGMIKHNFYQILNKNLLYSMLWIGFGLSYSCIALSFFITSGKLNWHYLLSLITYLVIILAPIVYWLGQTIPLTTNLFNQQQRVSTISGRALFINTMGSFLGAIVTSLVLFQYLGVACTVIINCILLLLLILLLRKHSHIKITTIALLSTCLIIIIHLNLYQEKYQFIKTNSYGNYRVYQQGTAQHLEINLSNSSRLQPNKDGFPYINFIRDLIFNKLQLQHKKILIIGAGGFSLTAQGTFNNQVTYVDIDPEIKTIAEQHFLKEKINGTFIGQNARLYLNTTKELFAVIVADAYNHYQSIPPALVTTNYFQQIANRLQTNGIFIANVIADPLFNNRFSQGIHNAIHQVFPYCNVLPLSWQTPANIIYVCYKQNTEKLIYTDDLNTANLDIFTNTKK